MKLEIGCGRTWLEGWEGLDNHDYGQKYICDLEVIAHEGNAILGDYGHVGQPNDGGMLGDQSVEEINCFNLLEHLTKPAALHLLNECARVLVPGGKLNIIVPNGAYPWNQWKDPTHVSSWVKGTFAEYLCGGRPKNADYNVRKWTLISLEEKGETAIFVTMTPRV